MRIMLLLLSIATLSVARAAGAGESVTGPDIANYFEVKLEIKRDGRLIGAPSAIVERGKPARVTYQDGTDNSGFRVDYSVEPLMTEKGLATADVRMVLYELRSGIWQLLGEPTIQTRVDGSKGSLEFAAGQSKIAVSAGVEIVTADALRARFGGSLPKAAVCGNDLDSPAGASLLGGGGGSNCCSGFCKPPPGTMTCCGAISCCACGVCCQVP